jgi:peptidoglycan/xylan/chitin deacetylase (PgdA/CDA1 family)
VAKGQLKGIPVLMYHALEDEAHPAGAVDAGEQLYVLKVSQFREQMEFLHREGYRTLLLEELQARAVWPDKAVVLTFDDGHESNFTLALPILLGLGFKAEFFITTGWIGTPFFMNEEQIQGLHRAGMGVGSHGVTHRFLPDLSEAEVIDELNDSKKVLEACIGVPVESMSYPGGRLNQLTQNLAQISGYQYICSSVPQLHQQVTNQTRIDRFAVTSDVTLDAFMSLVQGQGLKVLQFRHNLLATTKAVLGNDLYKRLRSVLIRSDR